MAFLSSRSSCHIGGGGTRQDEGPLRALPVPGRADPQVRARSPGAASTSRSRATTGGWKLIDDERPRQRPSAAQRRPSARGPFPYGHARVEVLDDAGRVVGLRARRAPPTTCWVAGLEPDTRLHATACCVERARVGRGPAARLASAGPGAQGMVESGRTYDNRFRTHPAAGRSRAASPSPPSATSAPACASPPRERRRQREVAAALEAAVDREDVRLLLTTGDNIYAGRTLLGVPVGATGDEDDDWFFTFFQPYRYLLNRIPVYPCIGNHDGNETEVNDDRDQIMDNFFLAERLLGEEAAGRASVGPGPLLPLPLRVADRVRRARLARGASCSSATASSATRTTQPFLEAAFPAGARADAPRWRIPFAHHPPYCAGPHARELEVAASSTWSRSTGAPACGWC